jgi:hypothetical protein
MGETRTEFVVLCRQRAGSGSGEWFHATGEGDYAKSRERAEVMLAQQVARTNELIAEQDTMVASFDDADRAYMRREVERLRSTEHAIFVRSVTAYALA